jgi:hypothetical protein
MKYAAIRVSCRFRDTLINKAFAFPICKTWG